MDTIMSLTVYNQPAEEGMEVLRKAATRIEELDALLSVTDENSEIYRVNHGGGEAVSLSEETRQLLAEALALCGSTGGALDVTIYPVVRAWGFTTGDYRVPEAAELSALLADVDYTRAALEGERLTLPEGVELDLGAVAKGWTGDQLMELFAGAGVTSAIVELGGNVQTLGAKPDGTPWRVALQAPEGGYAGVLEIVDKAVITSGGYQRCFEQDGVTYIHIIDPSTGYPAESGLVSATIVADRGVQGDGLSTALFVMGREKAEDYWRAHHDFDFILLCEDGTAVMTEGLEDSFSLYGGWEDSPLEIIRK
ncbi:MAG: FAD:protein FMN transferase [Oscillibacter sp.]|nr:FAD:protein FMN transferase [Oscillibacter sp.]